MRFGLTEIQPGQDQTNAERVIAEMYDLVAAVDLLMQEGALPGMKLENSPEVMAKQAKIEHYLKFSAECGTLDAAIDRTTERKS